MTGHWRSLLFVAADDASRLARVQERGADCIIVDLEDAVAPARKEVARASLPAEISRLKEAGQSVAVRINSLWRDVVDDLAAIAACPAVDAIIAPKAESAGHIAVLAEMLAEWLPQAPGIIALLESATGLAEARSIAAHPAVIGLAFGTEDFALSLGVSPLPAILDLPCRQIALAAAERQVMALALPISIAAFRDGEAYAAAITLARNYGLNGALCIHPAQVELVNRGFGASEEEVATARAILAAWDAAGGAGVIQHDGRMIDLPVVLRARQLVARAG